MHTYYFSCKPWIAAPKGLSLTTHFCTRMTGEETKPQKHQHPCPILLQFHHSSSSLCKNHKKQEVDRKIQACDTFTLADVMVLDFFMQMFKKVIISFINSELVRTLYMVGLLSYWEWKQQYIIIVCLRSHSFDKEGCDFAVCSGVGWNTYKI